MHFEGRGTCTDFFWSGGFVLEKACFFKVSQNGTKHTPNYQSDIFRCFGETLELFRVELREFGAK